jgi:hypothetical protein
MRWKDYLEGNCRGRFLDTIPAFNYRDKGKLQKKILYQGVKATPT